METKRVFQLTTKELQEVVIYAVKKAYHDIHGKKMPNDFGPEINPKSSFLKEFSEESKNFKSVSRKPGRPRKDFSGYSAIKETRKFLTKQGINTSEANLYLLAKKNKILSMAVNKKISINVQSALDYFKNKKSRKPRRQ